MTRVILASLTVALVAAPAAEAKCSKQERSPKGTHKLARAAWDYPDKNRAKIKRVREKARCSRDPKLVRSHIAKARAQYRKDAEAARSDCIPGVTVYAYAGGCWAIPGYIVACESGGSWSAYNPSGAAGPYQIMPEWGRPWPIDSVEDKREHHRIAARIWNGGAGASNWVCA